MKKLLLGFLFLVIAVVGVLIAAPNFVDWNEYKDLVTSEAKSATGRDLEIRGDIKVALLPSPALVVHDVHLANIEGTSNADMIALEKLEIRIALAPLLGGNLLIEAVKLIKPVVNLEILADGRNNMSFAPPSAKKPTANNTGEVKISPAKQFSFDALKNTVTGESKVGGLAVRVDNFVIEKGFVSLIDNIGGTTERIENLNGRFVLQSLTGPMESSGSAVVRGIPLSFAVNISSLVQGRTLPFNVDLTVIPGNVKTRLVGAVTNLTEDPQVKGKLTVDGQNLAEYLSALASGASLPNALSRPFNASANLIASQARTDIEDLNLQLNGTKGTGNISVKLGAAMDVNAILEINYFDVDALLKPLAGTSNGPGQGNRRGNKTSALTVIPSKNSAVSTRGKKNLEAFGLASLPAKLNATVNLSIEALTYNKSAIRQAKLNASLANQEVTINQMSALLPGSSDVALFGFISEQNKQPMFEGNVDMTTNDLRRVLEWAEVNVAGVSKDRLRKLSFASRIKANSGSVELKKLNLKIDSTTIKGGANIAFRARPSFGANFSIDRLNLDGYLPQKSISSAPKSVASGPGASIKLAGDPTASSAGGPSQVKAANPLAVLKPLGDFDANILLSIGSLTFQGVPVSRTSLNATLFNGDLKLTQLYTPSAAGLAIKFAGGIDDLKKYPKFNNFTFDVRGRDLSRLFKLADIRSPLTAKQIGPVQLKGTISGPPANLSLRTDLSAVGGKINLDGNAKPFEAGQPSFDAGFSIRHGNLPALIRRLGADYRPAGGKIGGINLKGRLSGTSLNIVVRNLTGNAAGVGINGSANVNLTAARPKMSINLTTGKILVDSLLPAKRTAAVPAGNGTRHAFNYHPLYQRAAWQNREHSSEIRRRLIPVATRQRSVWPGDPIDISVLRDFDGDVALKSKSLTWQKYRVDRVDLAAALNNGIADIRRLTGKMFGGDLKVGGQVIAQQIGGQYKSRISVTGVNMGDALRALGTKGFKSGRFDFVGELRSAGKSVREMIGALNGGGNMAIRRLDISGAGRGSMLASAAGLLTSLNQLGGQLTRGKGGRGSADFSGIFRINNGVASSDDFSLSSGVGDGSAKGTVDLPNWRINVAGEIQLAKNIALQMLTKQTNAPQAVPFKISGALDAPNVRLETDKLMGGILIPGLDKGLNKQIDKLRKKKGVGAIIDQLFPGAKPTQPAQQPSTDGAPGPQSPPPQQAPEQPSQLQKPKIEDFLKGILKGLGR